LLAGTTVVEDESGGKEEGDKELKVDVCETIGTAEETANDETKGETTAACCGNDNSFKT
jgi:hypothetical protein